jgi:hypothetical protein
MSRRLEVLVEYRTGMGRPTRSITMIAARTKWRLFQSNYPITTMTNHQIPNRIQMEVEEDDLIDAFR